MNLLFFFLRRCDFVSMPIKIGTQIILILSFAICADQFFLRNLRSPNLIF